MTVNEVRTVLKHLISTGEITDESQTFGRLITVVSYDVYQGSFTGKRTGKSRGKQGASTGNAQQSNNNKEIDNEKKESAPRLDGGRADWEVELDVPERFVGRFDSAEDWLAWKNNEGWDPH